MVTEVVDQSYQSLETLQLGRCRRLINGHAQSSNAKGCGTTIPLFLQLQLTEHTHKLLFACAGHTASRLRDGVDGLTNVHLHMQTLQWGFWCLRHCCRWCWHCS